MENLKEERIKAIKGQRFQVPKCDPHSFHLRTYQKFLCVAQVAVSSQYVWIKGLLSYKKIVNGLNERERLLLMNGHSP